MPAAGIGHNGGPETTGLSWRSHCWKQARNRLLPTLPIEVVRLRVKRASELGLDYKTYAGIRASTGHDLVSFLFSSNALRVLRASDRLPTNRREKLEKLQATCIGLVTPPLSAVDLLKLAPVLDEAHESPRHLDEFGEIRDRLRSVLGSRSGDTVLLVGDHPLEPEWCAAGRLAGYLSAERYFGP